DDREDVADEVLRRLHLLLDLVLGDADRLLVRELDHALLERPVEVEGEALLDGFLAEEHVLLEELLGDDVLRVADERVDRLANTVRRGDRRARRAEVDTDVEDALLALLRLAARERRVRVRLLSQCHEFLSLSRESARKPSPW